MIPNSELDELAHVLGALRPYLDRLVLVGGWAHRLFRFHPLAQDKSLVLVHTRDVDIAAPRDLRRLDVSLEDLLTQADYTPNRRRTYEPPATTYERAGAAYDVEFITDLVGPERAETATCEIAGASALRLRYLGALFQEPWKLPLGERLSPPAPDLTIQIANPVSYLYQKVLALEKRKPSERYHDVLYIYDTARIFAGAEDELHQLWTCIRDRLGAPHRKKFVAKWRELYAGDIGSTLREASVEAGRGGRSISPDQLQLACQMTFEIVFAEGPKGPARG